MTLSPVDWQIILLCFAFVLYDSHQHVHPTRRKRKERKGLVYSLIERQNDDHLVRYQRPLTLGVVVVVLAVTLNLIFW